MMLGSDSDIGPLNTSAGMMHPSNNKVAALGGPFVGAGCWDFAWHKVAPRIIV